MKPRSDNALDQIERLRKGAGQQDQPSAETDLLIIANLTEMNLHWFRRSAAFLLVKGG